MLQVGPLRAYRFDPPTVSVMKHISQRVWFILRTNETATNVCVSESEVAARSIESVL